jgi:hypothetical protein
MTISISQTNILAVRDAVLSAFPRYTDLKPVLQGLLKTLLPAETDSTERNKLRLISKEPYEGCVWRLVETWNAHGRIADLIGGLLRIVPNPQLRLLERHLLRMLPISSGITELQGFLRDGLGHEPALCWLERLRARMRCVCRIDALGFNPPGLGTGFLIQQDLVLSAYHVVEQVTTQPLLAENLHCRFDCVDELAASTPKGGRLVKLMVPGWSRAKSPPGPSEQYPGGAEPSKRELDFVLLRLTEPAADDPVGESGKRGVIPLAKTALDKDHPLLVLQHPNRAALRLSIGSVIGRNGKGTRLHHSAATEQGASGAPCLNQQLELVALHNAARYNTRGALAEYNTAVPIPLITEDLARHGLRLGALPPTR